MVIDADRAAKHHQQVGCERVELAEVTFRSVDVLDLVAGSAQRCLEATEILETDVADGLQGKLGHAQCPSIKQGGAPPGLENMFEVL